MASNTLTKYRSHFYMICLFLKIGCKTYTVFTIFISSGFQFTTVFSR